MLLCLSFQEMGSKASLLRSLVPWFACYLLSTEEARLRPVLAEENGIRAYLHSTEYGVYKLTVTNTKDDCETYEVPEIPKATRSSV